MRWRFNQSERSEGSKCQRKTGQESSVPAANFVFSDSEQKVSSSFSLFHPLPAWLDNINIHGIWIYSLHIAVHYLGIFPHMDVVFYLGVLYFLVLRQYLMGLFINWLYIGSRGENIDRRYFVQSIQLSSQYREVWSPQQRVSTIFFEVFLWVFFSPKKLLFKAKNSHFSHWIQGYRIKDPNYRSISIALRKKSYSSCWSGGFMFSNNQLALTIKWQGNRKTDTVNIVRRAWKTFRGQLYRCGGGAFRRFTIIGRY